MQSWPVCHIRDTTELYLAILRAILQGQNPPHGKHGFYLASPGSVVWEDLYRAMAKRLAERGLVESEEVTLAGDAELEAMAKGLESPVSMVRLQLGGQ